MKVGAEKGSRMPARFVTLVRGAGRDLQASRPVLAVLRADARITAALEEALAPAGLTLPKFNVLMELASSPEGRLPLHEICRRLLKSAPGITALVDRLEADGLVRRSRDAGDRRVVMAEITEAGWGALGAATPGLFAAEKLLLRGLSTSDRALLTALLDRIAP